MKTRNSFMSAALAAVAISSISGIAAASSHAEAPYTASDPDIDNADVWAWRKGPNLIVLATYNGLQPAYAAPNWKKFADNGAMYEIHLARGATSLDDAVTYQFRFSTAPYPRVEPDSDTDTPAGGNEFFSQISGGGAGTQTYTVTKIVNGVATQLVTAATPAKVAPPNIGPRTNAIAYGIPGGTTYEQFFVENAATSVIESLGANEGRVFAGVRDDPFFVDLGAVFDLAGLRSVIGGTPRNSTDFTNVMTIALEIPLTVANGGPIVNDGTPTAAQTVGVWASASRRKVTVLRADGTNDVYGPFRQVSRLGLPLINEAVIGLQDKDKWNRRTPKDDLTMFGAYFLNPIIVRDAQFAGFYEAGAPLAPCLAAAPNGFADLRTNRLDIVDVINIKDFPTAGAHAGAQAITSIGDVLRVDLGVAQSDFPNGRRLIEGQPLEPDVVDVELTLLLCRAELLVSMGILVPDGVNQAEVNNKTTFPYQATPWESFASGIHAPPSP
jgi:Domain of unknown function (DUF4331)